MSGSADYDRVPYDSHAQAATHPDVLATQATIFGMKPADPRRCRALFLGCGTGWNFLPMARYLPQAHFTGIDASEVQIAMGRADADALGLQNVELIAGDILDLPEDYGPFDYVIAHGVYSWVPPQVQARVLSLCRSALTPQGVAFVSFNAKPGWHIRSMLREMMLHHTRHHRDPETRVAQARALLSFLRRATLRQPEGGYRRWLLSELDLLARTRDFYLLHEHLTEYNEALFFHEFAERARAAGLQYLSEPSLALTLDRGLPDEVRGELDAATGDLLSMQQYLDFARGRHFRRCLLVREEVQLHRALGWQTLLPLRVAAPIVVQATPQALCDGSEVAFSRDDGQLATESPLLKQLLWHVGAAWPAEVSFEALVAQALDALGSPVTLEEARRIAGRDLLNCAASGFVDLRLTPRPVGQPGPTPRACPVTRLQAARGQERVTTLLHEPLETDTTMRALLCLLDGTRDRGAVIDALLASPTLLPEPLAALCAGQDTAEGRLALSKLYDQTLAHMARSGVFPPTARD